jgi:hypothetical protein
MGIYSSKFAVADDLSVDQRHFYERAKLKLATSLVAAAFGMMLLGFASIAGGNAQYQNYVKEHVAVSGYAVISAYDLAGGYGFSCFLYLVGFSVSTVGALYISPLIYSLDERTALQQPRRAATRESVVGLNPGFEGVGPTGMNSGFEGVGTGQEGVNSDSYTPPSSPSKN